MFTTLTSLLLAGATFTVSTPQQNEVKIAFDDFGIPHIDANTDKGAFFGAGFVAARDRWFQMSAERLRARGEMCEYFGRGFEDAFLKSDRRCRLLDWNAHANRVVGAMDPEHLGFLEAYCDGVNHWVSGPILLHSMFTTYQIPAQELWTPQDCIMVWMTLGDIFTIDGFAELAVDSAYDPLKTDEENLLAIFRGTQVADHTATIKQSDVDGGVQSNMSQYAAQKGINQHIRTGSGIYLPQFSDVLAVRDTALDTQGSTVQSILWGGPRLGLSIPNPVYEWHMRGETFDVRGAGVAGSPNILFGTTHHDGGVGFAWSMTAAGTDLGDLYKLKLTPFGNTVGYELNGNARGFVPDRNETILIKETPGDPNSTYSNDVVRRRGTYFGPVVTELLGTTEEYAMAFVPTQVTPALPVVDPIVAIVGMYRADNVMEFWDALGNYTFPSANLVFAASDSTIGYTVTGAVPVRSALESWAGILPMDGTTTNHVWQEYIPGPLQPRVENPESGYLYNANSLSIGGWYPMLPYYPGVGDTGRSYRLRKVMESSAGSMTASDVALLFKDRGTSMVRSIVNIALVMRDTQGFTFSARATKALDRLEPWHNLDHGLDGQSEGAVIAHFVSGSFDDVGSEPQSVRDRYGDRNIGFLNMLAEIERGLSLTPVPRLPQGDEMITIDIFLKKAWEDTKDAFAGFTISSWPQEYVNRYLSFGSDFLLNSSNPWLRTNQLVKRRLLAFTKSPFPLDPLSISPDNPDPSDPSFWESYGPVVTPVTGTLADVPSATYNLFAELGTVDGVQTMLAVGPSELPTSAFYTSSLGRLAAGDLKPSPQTVAGLIGIGVDFNFPDVTVIYP